MREICLDMAGKICDACARLRDHGKGEHDFTIGHADCPACLLGKGDYSRCVRDDGTIRVVFYDVEDDTIVGKARTFPDQETLDLWWELNAKDKGLVREVPHNAAITLVVSRAIPNKKWFRIRVEEKAWLAANAQYNVGDWAIYDDGCAHIANGALVQVTKVRMDHTHPSGHVAECWNVAKIEYEVALKWDPKTDKATLRWNSYARHLTPARVGVCSTCGRHDVLLRAKSERLTLHDTPQGVSCPSNRLG